jgi:hypothetical protein
MLETLGEILRLDNDTTKFCALRGLGHLHHPGVPAVVQEHIDGHSSGLDPDAIKWLEGCRDGTIL